MSAFPERARVVIVGLGGIVGASVAHHLIARGWDDIVGIDKSGIPTDIGSTAHASDFCYTTSHDFLPCWTTLYSIDFYERMGHYARIGGLEVARVGDDVRMDEIRRKSDSAKAFGTRARLIGPAEVKERFPLIEEELIQGGLWDPDAGLVIPRSQTVAGKLVDQGVVQDHVGFGQRLQPQRRDQAGIARAAAHQPDPARLQRRKTVPENVRNFALAAHLIYVMTRQAA